MTTRLTAAMMRAMHRGFERGRQASVAVAMLAFAAAACALADDPRVTISGGRDASGQSYIWTVKNDGESAIVRVEFPHYRGDAFEAPPDWKHDCKNLQGRPDTAGDRGYCAGFVDAPRMGIQPGRSATFGIRTQRNAAYRGSGTVLVTLADGRQIAVGGVDVPSPPSFLERFGMPIGLGAVLLVFLTVQLRRRRKARAAAAAASSSS